MYRGYIKIWRKVKDSGLYQLPNAFTMFVYMLTEATHKPIRFGSAELDRGQLCTGRHKLAFELGMSEQSVRTALENLHRLEMITSKATNKYTVYTIVNYNNYQDEQPIGNQQSNQPTTNEQPTSNQQLTTTQTHKHISTKENPSSSPSASEEKKKTPLQHLIALGADEQAAKDWLTVRKVKRAPLTETALNELKREAGKAGITIAQAVQICANKSWQGFNASYDWKDALPSGASTKPFNMDEFLRSK